MDKGEIILEHKIEEGKKIYDVTNLIYDMFNTYQVGEISAVYILTRLIHEIQTKIDNDIEEDENSD